MKLNKSKLLETLRKLNNGETAYQARKDDIKPHKSLKFDILETPSQAFIRKLRK